MKLDPGEISVAVLCGGLGKRLGSIATDRPKPMLEINGHPFLDFIIDYLLGYGIKKIVLCLGYKSEFIKEYYGKAKFFKSYILFSEEKIPLGTAGGLKNAEGQIKSDPFIVMNGDSLCEANLIELLDFHIKKQALASMALLAYNKQLDVGIVELGSDDRIVKFSEKKKKADNSENLFINAGVYVFSRDIFSFIPEAKEYSLEYELFPKLQRCFGYVTDESLIDIGTPESYYRAQKILNNKKIVRSS